MNDIKYCEAAGGYTPSKLITEEEIYNMFALNFPTSKLTRINSELDGCWDTIRFELKFEDNVFYIDCTDFQEVKICTIIFLEHLELVTPKCTHFKCNTLDNILMSFLEFYGKAFNWQLISLELAELMRDDIINAVLTAITPQRLPNYIYNDIFRSESIQRVYNAMTDTTFSKPMYNYNNGI